MWTLTFIGWSFIGMHLLKQLVSYQLLELYWYGFAVTMPLLVWNAEIITNKAPTSKGNSSYTSL